MKISVITAAYKSRDTVGEAIDSVARQSHADLEHLVVEGMSMDGTLEAIEHVAHERMRLISEPDGGIYDALNKGICNSTGQIIGFVHSDDVLAHDEVLERIVSAFDDNSVEAVFGDLVYVSKADTSRIIRYWSAGAFNPRLLRRGWMPPHPTLYLRRGVYDRLGLYDKTMVVSADYDFILRYFSQNSCETIYVPEVFYKMRVGGISNRSWSRVRQKMAEDMLAIRRNQVGGLDTLAFKNLSKVGQFVTRPPKKR